MIKLQNISVEFRDKNSIFSAVKDVTLDINRGEIFGIVGTSGAGKSTLLRTINLLQRPTCGKVWIENNDITQYKGEELRQIRLKIGMIFQSFNLIKGKTAAQNIAFSLKANGIEKDRIEARTNELLELVDLSEKGSAYPSQLSGGQKQRIGIARALANNPDILLCDEATSALDLENTEAIIKLLREINRKLNITIVFISHEMDVIKNLCQRVGVMNSGRLIEVGEVFDIFASPRSNFTKQLVNKVIDISIPEEIENLTAGILIKLKYKGKNAMEPIISKASKIFDVDLNILHGTIQYIGKSSLGILIIDVEGNLNEINRAIGYIKERVEELEVVSYGRNTGTGSEPIESAC